MEKQKIPNPRVESYIWGNTQDEIRALLLFVRHQWYVIALIVLAIGILINQLKPFPPSTIRLATGQPNSTLEILGKKYQESFKKRGVDIELIASKGAADSLELLKAGKVDAALSQGGLEIQKSSGVVSLGSIGYQPLWLFYTGADFSGDDLFEYLRGKRVYVGVAGSGTRIMVDALLKEVGQLDRPVFSPESGISARESVDALLSGRLDAVFLIAGHESGNAQALFTNPKVKILSFPIAEALARRISYVETVSIPRGSISISPLKPKSDVKMVATTTTLLAREDLHHAIQNLLLTSSKDIYNTERYFFDRAGGFPAFTDRGTPRSEVAEKYYQRGRAPFFTDYVPYWLASFIDLAWFSLLTAFAVIYPIFRLVPAYRKYIFGIFASRLYFEIFALEQALYKTQSAAELTLLKPKIQAMGKKVHDVWAPKGAMEAYSFVIGAMEVLMQRTNERLVELGLERINTR